MTTMRAVQIPHAGGPFELVERPIPEPGPGMVRLKVEACGVCHSDSITQGGYMPGIRYPVVPGHEIAGVVDSLGDAVSQWKAGQRAGVGWHGGHCGTCKNCRRGDFFACESALVTGVHYDGGYQEYVVVKAAALASIPDELSAVEAAPLMCAGVTTFNALRNAGARPGDLVAVLGLGGLGHLGVQFAVKMGYRVVAIARGADKAQLARELGAWRYIDNSASDPAVELAKLGGAKVVLATITEGEAMAATIGGLAPSGTLMVLGAAGTMTINPLLLISAKRNVNGWYSGTSIDSEDTMAFSALTGVRSMNEVYPLEKAGEAFERMMSGKARFRVVLTMAHAR